MDASRKKALLEEYKNRRPEMGLISYYCLPTGERFVNAVPDTKAAFNSTSFKLSTGSYPNKRLQTLWTQYKEESFELSVLRTLKYKEEPADYTKELKELLEAYLSEDHHAVLLWHRADMPSL